MKAQYRLSYDLKYFMMLHSVYRDQYFDLFQKERQERYCQMKYSTKNYINFYFTIRQRAIRKDVYGVRIVVSKLTNGSQVTTVKI